MFKPVTFNIAVIEAVVINSKEAFLRGFPYVADMGELHIVLSSRFEISVSRFLVNVC